MELQSLFGKKNSSKEVAKDRLKLVLIHDRADCSTDILDMMKNDIIKVISKYMDIDDNEPDIHITHSMSDENKSIPILYANIPIKNVLKKRV